MTATDPFGNSPTRPYLVLSNDRHPFQGREYVVAVVTTTARSRAVELEDDLFTAGSLPRRSYVSPSNPVTLKNHTIDKHVATVADSAVDDVVDELTQYLETP